MTPEFRKVGPSVWASSKRFRSLSVDAKLAYMYLLTNTHSTSIGLYQLRPIYMADDMDIDMGDALACLDEIAEVGLIDRDREENLIRIDRWFTINPITNPHHMIGTLRSVSRLPSSHLQLSVFFEIVISGLSARDRWTKPERIAEAFDLAHHTLRTIWRARGDEELACALGRLEGDAADAIGPSLSLQLPPPNRDMR